MKFGCPPDDGVKNKSWFLSGAPVPPKRAITAKVNNKFDFDIVYISG